MKRRIVSVLMALVMALSLLPVQALAEDAAVGEPVTEIEQAEQTGEGEEPGDPEEEQEPGEPEKPVREFVQGEAQLTASTAAMAAGTAGETTELADIHIALSVGGSLKLLLIAPPARHVRAAFRKRPRNGAPQPAARPRDKGFFPAQPFMSFHAVLLAESAGTGASVCRNENVSPLWMRHIVAFSTSIFRTIIFHKQKQAVI